MRQALTLLLAVGLVSLLSGNSIGNDDVRRINIKFEDVSTTDSPLKFKVQRTSWEYNRIRVWGTVTNTGSDDFQLVSVSFTSLDQNGQFLGREKVLVDPHKPKAGDVGDINGWSLDTDETVPAVLQYKISGNPMR